MNSLASSNLAAETAFDLIKTINCFRTRTKANGIVSVGGEKSRGFCAQQVAPAASVRVVDLVAAGEAAAAAASIKARASNCAAKSKLALSQVRRQVDEEEELRFAARERAAQKSRRHYRRAAHYRAVQSAFQPVGAAQAFRHDKRRRLHLIETSRRREHTRTLAAALILIGGANLRASDFRPAAVCPRVSGKLKAAAASCRRRR